MDTQDSIKFELNIESVKGIPFGKYDKDFTFIVNSKEFQTSRFVADILSPRIRNYHFIDETINKFCINLNESSQNGDFSDIFSLVSFETHEIKREQLNFFRTIFFSLDNKNEFIKLIPKNEEELTTNNIFNRIHEKQEYFDIIKSKKYDKDDEQHKYQKELNDEYLGISTEKEFFKDEIQFLSNHFFEIEKEKLKKLDVSFIEEIVKSDKLQLKDEDSLLKFIIELYSINHKYSYLFEYVDYFNISQEELEHFYKIFDLNDINQRIWSLIIERTMSQKTEEIKNKNPQRNQRYNKQEEGISLIHKEGQEFNGIIKYLTEKTGGNIHDNETIEITSNSYYSGDHPKNLLDFNDKTKYESPRSDAWICFDFKKKKVKITSYSIKSYEGGKNDCHLKSWNVEVSNDGENWNVIDQQLDCQELNGDRQIATFGVQSKDFTNYVRIRQTDEPWGGNYLKICCIEFFGFLKE